MKLPEFVERWPAVTAVLFVAAVVVIGAGCEALGYMMFGDSGPVTVALISAGGLVLWAFVHDILRRRQP